MPGIELMTIEMKFPKISMSGTEISEIRRVEMATYPGSPAVYQTGDRRGYSPLYYIDC